MHFINTIGSLCVIWNGCYGLYAIRKIPLLKEKNELLEKKNQSLEKKNQSLENMNQVLKTRHDGDLLEIEQLKRKLDREA